MILEPGALITLKHFFSNSYMGVVVDAVEDTDGETITVKISKETGNFEFNAGETVSVSFEAMNKMYFATCLIKEVNGEAKYLILKVDVDDFSINCRGDKRFPVTYCAVAQEESSHHIHDAIIRNISFQGMMFITHYEFRTGQDLLVKINDGVNVISLVSQVMWCKLQDGYYECGLKNVIIEDESAKQLRLLIERLNKERERFLVNVKVSMLSEDYDNVVNA